MTEQERMDALQKRMEQLSRELSAGQMELYRMKNELARLRHERTGVSSPGKEPVQMVHEPAPEYGPGNLERFIGLKLIHIVGIILLVIGVSISVKYAIDRELISPFARILLAYLAGFILFGLSVRLRKNYASFSAILFSGAMATVYFTTYGAFVYYQFLTLGTTWLLMTALTVFTAWNAIRYNRQEIAILGMIGAYAIPFLISSNADRVDLFFGYILIINLGVGYLSLRKDWQLMKTLALVVSWALFGGWGLVRFAPEWRTAALVFLVCFYLLFTLMTLGPALRRRQAPGLTAVQNTVINNMAAYGAMVILFSAGTLETHWATVTGCFSLYLWGLVVAVYLFLPQAGLFRKNLAIQALAMWVFFVPLQWDHLAVTLVWLCTAGVLFAWGVWFKTAWVRMSSLLLIGLTLLKLIVVDSVLFSTVEKIIAFLTIGAALLAGAFFYQRLRKKFFNGES